MRRAAAAVAAMPAHCDHAACSCYSVRYRLEADHGIVLRFVAGSMSDPAQEAALEAEQTQHGDILRLLVQVCVCV